MFQLSSSTITFLTDGAGTFTKYDVIGRNLQLLLAILEILENKSILL